MTVHRFGVDPQWNYDVMWNPRILNGVASLKIWSCYANFKLLSLISISLEIACFYSKWTPNIWITGPNRRAGYATAYSALCFILRKLVSLFEGHLIRTVYDLFVFTHKITGPTVLIYCNGNKLVVSFSTWLVPKSHVITRISHAITRILHEITWISRVTTRISHAATWASYVILEVSCGTKISYVLWNSMQLKIDITTSAWHVVTVTFGNHLRQVVR